MTQKQFDAALAGWLKGALERASQRLDKLRKVQRGDASLRKVRVKSYTVPSFTVRSHYRYI